MHWKKVTLLGVGLLGGSLGLALKKRGLADHIYGFVRRESSVQESLQVGAVDEAGLDLGKAVRGADLIVFCTPISQMVPLMKSMTAAVEPGALITDVGSVKVRVIEGLAGLAREAGAEFLGSHPMAGSEKVGVTHARAELFERAVCVVTPTEDSSEGARERLRALWHAVGGVPLVLDPEMHDVMVSRSSHLPHVVAAELARHALNPQWPPEQSQLCATGFRDVTRIASGSPGMWTDISLANRENLVKELEALCERLQDFKERLVSHDDEAVLRYFEEARQRRDAWCDHHVSPTLE